uniref:MYND-type domain-containing protein n=1 Tax=Ananas comosus var. bracteatus TaxID=296719 RepID=A0A6V7PQD5_ANACO|nr:unnamed protein product [Ananas comosus var. bracteatus]
MRWTEDLQRALSARGLTVASIPGKGRGLVATRDFYPGEVIICQEPYASAPNKVSAGSSCDGCFASSNIRKCSACRIAWYCGNACQRAEWKLHQLECQVLAALSEDRKKMLTPAIRLMVRLVLRKKLQNEKVIPTSETDNYDLVNALESHISGLDEKQLVLYAQMANLVKLVLPSLEIDLKEITHNFSKLDLLSTDQLEWIEPDSHNGAGTGVFTVPGTEPQVPAAAPSVDQDRGKGVAS